MPVCVECANPVSSLYTEYGKGHIVLAQCQKVSRACEILVFTGHFFLGYAQQAVPLIRCRVCTFSAIHSFLQRCISWLGGCRTKVCSIYRQKMKFRMDSIIAGLILSSFGKFLHTVMVIWDYREMEFSYLVNMTVFTSNLEAIAG
ncbi:hypothetical protein PSACC_01334 [Paramicrosporidium saccamoebae]|uniref:Protein ARV n=1 Tax=Paramicrosporidium saccamoebae TaxID=1246581 RepID=A0A2H9TM00_9FUNG|nr:hypothetical protein PSACC_01334 [Paramicrosporidium saccamoebae]